MNYIPSVHISSVFLIMQKFGLSSEIFDLSKSEKAEKAIRTIFPEDIRDSFTIDSNGVASWSIGLSNTILSIVDMSENNLKIAVDRV